MCMRPRNILHRNDIVKLDKVRQEFNIVLLTKYENFKMFQPSAYDTTIGK